MRHHYRTIRNAATRLLNFDSPRPAFTCDDTEDYIFFCACEFINSQHSVNCPTNLKWLVNSKHSAADVQSCWDKGLKGEDPGPNLTREKGIAYCMGRDSKKTFPDKVPRFAELVSA